ncbi:hypothetical protein ES703_79866 [subsurface metagenome]
MIKRIDEYEEYKKCERKVNKQRKRFESFQKLHEQYEKDNLDLEDSLGIEKVGDVPDFEKITKSKEQTKIRGREMRIAEKDYLDAQKQLEDKILGIKKLRRAEAREVGLKLNKRLLKVVRTIRRCKEQYLLLRKELSSDLSERDIIDRGSIETIIGPSPNYVDFSNRLSFSSDAFLKRSKIYHNKKDEVKDI